MVKQRSSKNILIVNFNHPPSPSIGGRRWTFFGKYLQQAGHGVFVITSDFNDKAQGECPWQDCIKAYEKNIFYLKHKTPYHVLATKPSTLLSKIKYRLSLWRARNTTNSNEYDRALYFSKDALTKAKELITHYHIKTVICTGGPFSLITSIIELKKEFDSKVNVIIDLRDPWAWGQEFDVRYKKGRLDRKRNEYHKMTNCLELADKIYVPVSTMAEDLGCMFPLLIDKIKVVPHGFDHDNFSPKQNPTKLDFNKWFYAGALYTNMEKEVATLKALLTSLPVSLDIYSYSSQLYPELIKLKNVSPYRVINQKKLNAVTSDFGVALILLPKQFKDYQSSKFYELIHSGKFLLFIGEKGIVSDYIVKHNLGMVVLNENSIDVTRIESDLTSKIHTFTPQNELVMSFSFINIVKELIEPDL